MIDGSHSLATSDKSFVEHFNDSSSRLVLKAINLSANVHYPNALYFSLHKNINGLGKVTGKTSVCIKFFLPSI